MKITKYKYVKTSENYYYSPVVSLGHDEISFCSLHLKTNEEMFRKIAYKFNSGKDSLAEQMIFNEEDCVTFVKFLNKTFNDTVENKIKLSFVVNGFDKSVLYANGMVFLWEDICDNIFGSTELYSNRKLLKKFNSEIGGYFVADRKDAEIFRRYLQYLEEKLELPKRFIIET